VIDMRSRATSYRVEKSSSSAMLRAADNS
jgi:hypothetical protein